MSVIINFSAELRAWILHNLDRGCTAQDLVDSMVAQKFEPIIAQEIIAAFSRARREGVEPPTDAIEIESELDEYRYEPSRLATDSVIRTVDREIPVLLRLQQPIIALLENVLSVAECEELIALARPRLQPPSFSVML